MVRVGGDAIRIREVAGEDRWDRLLGRVGDGRACCGTSPSLLQGGEVGEALGVDLPLRVQQRRRAGARRRRSVPPASSSATSGSGMSGLATKVKSRIGEVNRKTPGDDRGGEAEDAAEASRGLEAHIEERRIRAGPAAGISDAHEWRRPPSGRSACQQSSATSSPIQARCTQPRSGARGQAGEQLDRQKQGGRHQHSTAARRTMSQPSILNGREGIGAPLQAIQDRLGDGQGGTARAARRRRARCHGAQRSDPPPASAAPASHESNLDAPGALESVGDPEGPVSLPTSRRLSRPPRSGSARPGRPSPRGLPSSPGRFPRSRR